MHTVHSNKNKNFFLFLFLVFFVFAMVVLLNFVSFFSQKVHAVLPKPQQSFVTDEGMLDPDFQKNSVPDENNFTSEIEAPQSQLQAELPNLQGKLETEAQRNEPETAQTGLASVYSNPESVLVLVNKQYPLSPKDFYPKDLVAVADGGYLRSEAAIALKDMFAAAVESGTNLSVTSSFRSYASQAVLYRDYVSKYGEAEANTFSAKPGFSEHQTGLTADLTGAKSCGLDSCPTNAVAWDWLAKNAHNFGFILRYPEGYENVTGYIFEPWHYRFVGIEVAQKMKNNNIATFEQFVLA